MQQDDELNCENDGCQYFDEVIGHIEDIVLSVEFEALQRNFLQTYWQCIEDSEENKLEYMDIFNEYTSVFENFLVAQLNERMLNFDMQRFATELDSYNRLSNTNALDNGGEIFELLHSLTNFQTFKELLLAYRAQMEGHVQHLDFDILITKPIYSAHDNTEST